MEIKNKILALTLICIAASSCVKAKLEEAYNKQDTQIDSYVNNYVKSNTKTFNETIVDTVGSYTETVMVLDTTYLEGTDQIAKIDTTYEEKLVYETVSRDTSWTFVPRVVYSNGSTRLVKKEGTGPELKANGSVSFYYAGYTFSGSINKAGLFVTNHQQTAESSHSLAQRLLGGSPIGSGMTGCTLLKGGAYTSHHDHRMVMALKVASLGADGPIIIDDEECVAKSFPHFNEQYKELL